jgi:transposase
MQIITIGLDLAKSVFQIHGVDATGQVAVRKSLRRSQMLPFFAKLPPCLVGIEACGTSHHWAVPFAKRLLCPSILLRIRSDEHSSEAERFEVAGHEEA